jgi:hypothetical protein
MVPALSLKLHTSSCAGFSSENYELKETLRKQQRSCLDPARKLLRTIFQSDQNKIAK